MKCKTVTIDRNGKKVLINESDFVAGLHKRWGDDAPEVAESTPGNFAETVENDKKEFDRKDELIEALAGLGIKKDRRSSVETLEELYMEAQQ
jgi:hypothetical protein